MHLAVTDLDLDDGMRLVLEARLVDGDSLHLVLAYLDRDGLVVIHDQFAATTAAGTGS